MSAAPPRVTVLMPVHNAGAFLAETLDSLRRQTLKQFDILAIDDGSTDESAAILRACRDPRLRWVQREARGVTETLNEGLDLCATPLVARMDADDRCHPERLERQLRAMQADPGLVVVGTAAAVIDAGGAALGEISVVARDAAIRRALAVTNCFVHGSVMYRTDAARRTRYRAEARPAADYDFLVRLAAHGATANLAEPLYEWRTHPAGVSRSQRAAQRHAAERIADGVWAGFGADGPAPRRAWPDIWDPGLEATLASNLHLQFARGQLRRGRRAGALAHVVAALRARPGSIAAWSYLGAMAVPARGFVGLEGWARTVMERKRGW